MSQPYSTDDWVKYWESNRYPNQHVYRGYLWELVRRTLCIQCLVEVYPHGWELRAVYTTGLPQIGDDVRDLADQRWRYAHDFRRSLSTDRFKPVDFIAWEIHEIEDGAAYQTALVEYKRVRA